MIYTLATFEFISVQDILYGLKLPPSFENKALIYQVNIFSEAHSSGGLGPVL